MCCFSRPIPYVARTKIFARQIAPGRQALIYSMDFATAAPVAMVLPLPLAADAGEDAVGLVDLSGYRTFFADLERAFPPIMLTAAKGGSPLRSLPQAKPQLKVHAVGDFIASLVPTVDDFPRLAPEFRLPPEVIAALDRRTGWGFAVAQLAPTRRGWLGRLSRSRRTLAPLALTFPTHDPHRLFFPTVHVHDGQVHAAADFDHLLYWQGPGQPPPAPRSSTLVLGEPGPVSGPLGRHVDVARTAGLVDGTLGASRQVLAGTLPNRDQWIDVGPDPVDAAA